MTIFLIEGAHLQNLRRERARRALADATEGFGQRQREIYEHCAATEEEIGASVAILAEMGEHCVRYADELAEAVKGLGLSLGRPVSTPHIARLFAEIVAEQLKDGGEIVLRAVDLEFA